VLAAGDTVNCLFTDALHPPPGRLRRDSTTT
jgi:hypothetical protein